MKIKSLYYTCDMSEELMEPGTEINLVNEKPNHVLSIFVSGLFPEDTAAEK